MQRGAFAVVGFGLAIAVGGALRLVNLGAQVLGGDEVHALLAAVERPLGAILVTYQQADHSIPLTALYRLWIDAGGALSEPVLRAPIVASGIALLALLPLAAWRAFGPALAVRYAWLLAIAPGLVLYGRIVRSYAPMVLLATLAAVAAWRWIERGTRGAGVAYVLLAAAATWLHLGAAPFVLAPLGFAIAERALGRGDRPARAIAAVAAGVALGFAAFLVPAHASLAELWSGRRQTELPGLATWIGVAKLQAGSASAGIAAAWSALAAAGLAQLARSQPRAAAYTGALVASSIAGLLVLRPYLFHEPLVLNRYLLPCLPVALLWIACAFGALETRAAALAPLATAAWIALAFAAGPLADPAYRTSSFVHRNDFLDYRIARPSIDPAQQPAFYARHAGPDVALVEMPWHSWWGFARAVPIHQERHRGPVRVAGPGSQARRPGIDLRNTVPVAPDALAATGADWVVLHLDPGAEEARVREAPGALHDLHAPAYAERIFPGLRRAAQRIRGEIEAAWGPPDHEDADVVAWRLPRPAVAESASESAEQASARRADAGPAKRWHAAPGYLPPLGSPTRVRRARGDPTPSPMAAGVH